MENKIKLAKSRHEMQNDALFDAQNENNRLQEHVSRTLEEQERALEKKREVLDREVRSDI